MYFRFLRPFPASFAIVARVRNRVGTIVLVQAALCALALGLIVFIPILIVEALAQVGAVAVLTDPAGDSVVA